MSAVLTHPGAAASTGDAGHHAKRGVAPWLVFPWALERRFILDRGADRLRHFLSFGIVALLVYDAYLVCDWLMLPDVFAVAAWWRLVVFTPAGLVIILFGWLLLRFRGRFESLWLYVVAELAVSGIGLFASISVALIVIASSSPMAAQYHAGFTIIAMYNNIVQRVRFWVALPTSGGILAAHVWSAYFTGATIAPVQIPVTMLVAAVLFFTLVANYSLERAERRGYLERQREQALLAELAEKHERLQELARQDTLTGLANRRHFDDSLRQIWERVRFDGGELALLMIDVDHFKAYNDHYGHPAGDACLQQVAAAVRGALRQPTDLLARYGGEEFVAVLPHASPERARQAAERVRLAVEGLRLPHDAALLGHVSISLGLACVQPAAVPSIEAALAASDRALYQAKHEGRNRVCESA